jgi:hypothetical protein
MSELPPAPPVGGGATPPPEPRRWLGPRAPYWGLATGLLAYLPGLVLAIVFLAGAPYSNTDGGYDGIVPLVLSFLAGSAATLAVLIAAIVLASIPRTRGFGAGMAIALAIGIIGGAGICVSMTAVA